MRHNFHTVLSLGFWCLLTVSLLDDVIPETHRAH